MMKSTAGHQKPDLISNRLRRNSSQREATFLIIFIKFDICLHLHLFEIVWIAKYQSLTFVENPYNEFFLSIFETASV